MNAIVDKFRTIPTTCISDVMQGLNNLDPAIKPLKEEYIMAGRSCTVKMMAGDNMAVLKGIRQAKPGDILVVDAKDYLYSAAAGDFVIGLAHTLGLGGVVIDGSVRDVISIKNSNFPVFCKGTTVACSKKYGIGEVNVPISCGGAAIQPGDIIVGDADGVVVIPQSKAESVLKAAMLKLQNDQERAETILGNPQDAERYIDSLLTDSCK